MYCYKCGVENKEGDKFCYKCGNELTHGKRDKIPCDNSVITKTKVVIAIILSIFIFAGYFLYCQIAFHEDIDVGDVIQFGTYLNEPIAWRCYAKKKNKRFLIAENIIEIKPYHNGDNYVTWENCSLRQWLNSDFYNQAFNWQDALKIDTVSNVNLNNPETGAHGGNITNDKIFCLSANEVQKFFPSKTSKLCMPSAYLITRLGKYFSTKPAEFPWWLRTIGSKNIPHNVVHQYGTEVVEGELWLFGFDVRWIGGVRPAMWINIRK